MILYLLAFAGGVLTIVSPCVLPVVPFLFARAGQPFRRSVLPTLAGMALTFATIASAATVGGAWIVQANRYGRFAALLVMGVLGVTLLVPALAERLARPLVRFGGWLQGQGGSPTSSAFFAGVAIGFLWAPCAGPILGLVLTGAAIGGATAETVLLLFSFAAGAALSLGIVLLAGGRFFNAFKRRLGAEVGMKRILGLAVVAGVIAIAMGWDTGILARVNFVDAASAEQQLVDRLGSEAAPAKPTSKSLADFAAEQRRADLPEEGVMPPLEGATTWLNSAPLTRESLRGKVVLVNFWTFGCYNCLNALPHVKELHRKYADQGLVVIGVHTPEFPREKDLGNVRGAIQRLGVEYPVPVDNDYKIWRAFKNHYWPAAYYVDAMGEIRYHHLGEGRYKEQDQVVRKLLAEARASSRQAAR